MNVDLKNSTVIAALFGPVSQNNNTGGGGLDLSNYIGEIALTVSVGTKTVGDADGAISIQVKTSATNNISNAVNYTPTSGSAVVSTSNNATAVADVSVDTRNASRYLFVVPTVTGTNTPAYPVSCVVRGVKKNTPGI